MLSENDVIQKFRTALPGQVSIKTSRNNSSYGYMSGAVKQHFGYYYSPVKLNFGNN